jgi:hypothetical protein
MQQRAIDAQCRAAARELPGLDARARPASPAAGASDLRGSLQRQRLYRDLASRRRTRRPDPAHGRPAAHAFEPATSWAGLSTSMNWLVESPVEVLCPSGIAGSLPLNQGEAPCSSRSSASPCFGSGHLFRPSSRIRSGTREPFARVTLSTMSPCTIRLRRMNASYAGRPHAWSVHFLRNEEGDTERA